MGFLKLCSQVAKNHSLISCSSLPGTPSRLGVREVQRGRPQVQPGQRQLCVRRSRAVPCWAGVELRLARGQRAAGITMRGVRVGHVLGQFWIWCVRCVGDMQQRGVPDGSSQRIAGPPVCHEAVHVRQRRHGCCWSRMPGERRGKVYGVYGQLLLEQRRVRCLDDVHEYRIPDCSTEQHAGPPVCHQAVHLQQWYRCHRSHVSHKRGRKVCGVLGQLLPEQSGVRRVDGMHGRRVPSSGTKQHAGPPVRCQAVHVPER